jgi:hypothetical protein
MEGIANTEARRRDVYNILCTLIVFLKLMCRKYIIMNMRIVEEFFWGAVMRGMEDFLGCSKENVCVNFLDLELPYPLSILRPSHRKNKSDTKKNGHHNDTISKIFTLIYSGRAKEAGRSLCFLRFLCQAWCVN